MFDFFLDGNTVIEINLVVMVIAVMCLRADRHRASDRWLFGAITATLVMVYYIWRWKQTLPDWHGDFASLWSYLFFIFESIAIFYTMISIATFTRTSNHSADADAGEAWLRRAPAVPAVDVFIATYNEGLDVLEKTIVAALAIDYPNFRVWVLDDTRRGWLKEFCKKVGANYVTRPDNTHAKAGNLNNGLRHSELKKYGGGAPFIMVLDADFAANRNILMRIIGLFGDPKVGVVQTPQFYYNADPIQYNLRSTECWVDEQRAFFDVMQPARDAWGTAFCIGTSFVVRREALHRIGGFPTGTVTEDIHLSYKLMPHGYVTRWLNERLSVGLSAEGLPEFISQRTRWGLGTIQVALTADGPLRGRGYSFLQRLHYLHGLMHWLVRPFSVLLLLAPLLYWYFDIPAFYCQPMQFFAYGLPALLMYWAYSMWITGARAMPIFTEVTQTVTSLAVTAMLASAVFKPFGRPFKVTNKGLDRSKLVVHGKFAAMYGGMFVLAGLGLARETASNMTSTGLLLNAFWTAMTMILYMTSLLVCFELPRPRKEERFPHRAASALRLQGSGPDNVVYELPCVTRDLSCNGVALVSRHAGSVPRGTEGKVWLGAAGWVPCTVMRRKRNMLGISLQPDMAARHALIRMLFSNPADNIANVGRPRLAIAQLIRRAFTG